MKKCPKCNTKYFDTDFYCLKDKYRLINCNDNELTNEDIIKEKYHNDKINNPNKYGHFASNTNTPKCPICKSINIHKISKTNKVGSATFFGLFSLGYLGKTFKCNSCGMKF